MSKMPRDDGTIVEATPCPKCGADTGEPYQTARGRIHTGRVHTARKEATEGPTEPTETPKPKKKKVEDGHSAIEFQGWAVYTNTGHVYRKWRFRRAVPAVSAAVGFFLHDLGPTEKRERFQVRGGGELVESFTAEQAAEMFFLGDVPTWSPPHGVDLDLRDAIKDFTAAVEKLATNVDATKRLGLIQQIVDDRSQIATGDGPSNAFVRLRGDFEYNNGDPYRDWELLVDVPEIPVTRVKGATPMHAAKGDVLREQDDDRLTPFELRRDGRRIGDPEWWQVRHLFVGLEAETFGVPEDGDSGDHEGASPSPRSLHHVLPQGPDGDLRYKSAWIAESAIPGTPIREGDVVLKLRISRDFLDQERAAIRGSVTRIRRKLFATIVEHFDRLRFVEGWGRGRCSPENSFPRYLGHHSAQRGKDETSPVVIVRPWVAPVSEPVEASSDEAALFELITATGGRMPEE